MYIYVVNVLTYSQTPTHHVHISTPITTRIRSIRFALEWDNRQHFFGAGLVIVFDEGYVNNECNFDGGGGGGGGVGNHTAAAAAAAAAAFAIRSFANFVRGISARLCDVCLQA